MKLLRMLEDITSSPTLKNFDKSKLQAKHALRNDSSSGMYSRTIKSDVPEFKKETHFPFKNEEALNKDGYFIFAKMVKEHQNNVFFPKISNIKLVTAPNGNVIPKVTMEPLVPFFKVQPELGLSIVERLITEDTFKRLEERFASRGEVKFNIEAYKFLRQAISYGIDTGIITDDIINKKLIEAVKNCHEVFKEANTPKRVIRTDVNGGNIMLRGNGISYQLVITDPFANFGEFEQIYER